MVYLNTNELIEINGGERISNSGGGGSIAWGQAARSGGVASADIASGIAGDRASAKRKKRRNRPDRRLGGYTPE